MKYDCLVHLYNLYYEKDGNIVKGGLYTNCFIDCDLNVNETDIQEQISEVNDNDKVDESKESDPSELEQKSEEIKSQHDYNNICQKAGNYVGDSLQDFIKNPESDPVKFEIEKVAVYDENTSKLMGLALYIDK